MGHREFQRSVIAAAPKRVESDRDTNQVTACVRIQDSVAGRYGGHRSPGSVLSS
jgi:hypothetical protein